MGSFPVRLDLVNSVSTPIATRVARRARAGVQPPAAAEADRPLVVAARPNGRAHLLTIVLEDYFNNFGHVIERSHWNRFETRVERGTRRALDLLDAHGIRATFFAVGWIAETMPELIRDVAARGHEVASKGYDQRGVHDQSPDVWQDDVARARETIERASGRRVLGYRSPGWAAEEDLWSLEVLANDGYLYDSSIKPLGLAFRRQPGRLVAHVNRFGNRTLWEFPVASASAGGFRLPIGTGNYVRQLPEWLMQRAVAHGDRSVADPFVMYFHTWELDPDQPQITAISPLSRMRFYRNIDKMHRRLGEYFQRYEFTNIQEYLGVEDELLPPSRAEPARKDGAAAMPLRLTPGRGAEPVRVSLVVPCYNEESSLPYLARTLASLEEALAPQYAMEFVLVDDRSTDNSWIMLQQLFGNRPNCRLVRHEANYGPAVAILNGIRAAHSEIVASIDCDCSYDPLELAKMLPLLGDNVTMVTASPYHPRGGVRNVPEWRLFLSRNLSSLYRTVLHQKLSTYTSCFRVYRRSAMLDMTLKHSGFLGIAEMLGRVDLAGGAIAEYPTVLNVRVLGYSKMRVARTIVGHLRLLTQLMLLRGLARRKTRRAAVRIEESAAVRQLPESRPSD